MAEVLTPTDVISVRLHLLHLLPAKLAQKILDDAEYWPSVVGTFAPRGGLRVAARHENAYIAARCCVLTPPIPAVAGIAVRARRVRFELRSHDQGWGGEEAPGACARPLTADLH